MKHFFRILFVLTIAIIILFSPSIRSFIRSYSEASVDAMTIKQQKVQEFSQEYEKIKEENNTEKIQSFLNETLQALDEVDDKAKEKMILEKASSLFLEKGFYDKSLQCSQRLYQKAIHENSEEMKAKALFLQGSSQLASAEEQENQELKEKMLHEAQNAALEGLKIAEKLDFSDTQLKGKFYYLLARVYIETPSSSLSYVEYLLLQAKKQFEMHPANTSFMGVFVDLAGIYFLQGQIEKAEQFLSLVNEDSVAQKDKIQIAFIKAQIQAAKGDIEKAIATAAEAMEKTKTLSEKKHRKLLQGLLTQLYQVKKTNQEVF